MSLKKNGIEWTVFAASVIVIAAVIALLVRDAMSSRDAPPDLRVTVGAASQSSGGFVMPVQIENAGDTTAEQAKVAVRLLEDGTEVETAELTVAFVPGKSKRTGAVVFSRDPRCCSIEARAVSYEDP